MYQYQLPPELWFEILVNLPVRSAIQCTSVCKQWNSIITTTSGFVSDHLRLSRHNQNPLLLAPSPTRSHNPNTFSLNLDDSPLRLSQTLTCPFPTLLNGPFRVVGSVNGLVLLSDDLSGYPRGMVLWNPSIRRSVTLPKPRLNYSDIGPYTFVLGFGFDSVANDYKVVRLVYLRGRGSNEFEPPPLVEVYSLRGGSWRTVAGIASGVDCVLLKLGWTQCFVHGAVHWIGYRRESRFSFDVVVLRFDVEREEFKTMALPGFEKVVGLSPFAYSVSVVGGLLCVCVRRESYTDIWVKKDYCADSSWTLIATLETDKQQVGAWLDLKKCCEQISSGRGGRANGWRDIQVSPNISSRVKFLDNFVFSYTESLVLLDEDKAVKDVR